MQCMKLDFHILNYSGYTLCFECLVCEVSLGAAAQKLPCQMYTILSRLCAKEEITPTTCLGLWSINVD